MGSSFERIFKKADQGNNDIAMAGLHRAVEEQRRDVERAMSSIIKAVTDTARENNLDMRPFQTIVKEAKLETDQILATVMKSTSELHNAVSWTIPTKLSELASQGEKVLNNNRAMEA